MDANNDCYVMDLNLVVCDIDTFNKYVSDCARQMFRDLGLGVFLP